MSDTEAFDEFAHDLRGTMGSLRLVMSSLIDEEDAEQRRVMLALAEEEVQRVALCAGALPALAAADRSAAAAEIDLGPALADAASAALRYGVRATVAPAAPARVVSRPEALAFALPALFQLAAGTTGATTVSCEPDADGIRIECTTATMWPQARHLVSRLVDAAGARLLDSDSVRFVLPAVS